MSRHEELQEDLSALHAEFASPMEELDGNWLGGFQNVHGDLVNALLDADEDYFPQLAARAYVSPPVTKEDLPRLYELTWKELSEVTPYAQLAVKVRYCAGYLGNASLGKLIDRDQCAALIFGYEAYWKFGKDYILGSVVESLLSRLPSPNAWKGNPKASEITSEDKARSALAADIGQAMLGLYAYYRSDKSGGLDGIATTVKPKPEFIEFRSKLESIEKPPGEEAKRGWWPWR